MEEARGHHDQDPRARLLVSERDRRGERLHRLAEPHFIAEERSPLGEDEPSPEVLIAAQSEVEALETEGLIVDSREELRGESAREGAAPSLERVLEPDALPGQSILQVCEFSCIE